MGFAAGKAAATGLVSRPGRLADRRRPQDHDPGPAEDRDVHRARRRDRTVGWLSIHRETRVQVVRGRPAPADGDAPGPGPMSPRPMSGIRGRSPSHPPVQARPHPSSASPGRGRVAPSGSIGREPSPAGRSQPPFGDLAQVLRHEDGWVFQLGPAGMSGAEAPTRRDQAGDRRGDAERASCLRSGDQAAGRGPVQQGMGPQRPDESRRRRARPGLQRDFVHRLPWPGGTRRGRPREQERRPGHGDPRRLRAVPEPGPGLPRPGRGPHRGPAWPSTQPGYDSWRRQFFEPEGKGQAKRASKAGEDLVAGRIRAVKERTAPIGVKAPDRCPRGQ